jgi:hypothetical protein
VCHQPLQIPATKAAVELKCLLSRVGQVNFFRKVLSSFRHRKSAKFLMCACPLNANPQIFMTSLKTILKVLFSNDLWSRTILNLSIKCHICKKKKYVFAFLRKFENHKKDWIRKSQIRKVPHLRKVRKSNKLFKSSNLWICDERNYLRTAYLLLMRKFLIYWYAEA